MFIQYLFNRDSSAFYKFGSSYKINDKERNLIAKTNYTSATLVEKNKLSDSYRISQKFTNRELISPNFAARLINKYWQETIFLSITNPLSEKYINQLKSSGTAMYQNEYKKFLLDFSNALITGRIEASLNDSKLPDNTKNNPVYIKYVWRKGLNFSLPDNIFEFFTHKNDTGFSKTYRSGIIKKIKYNDFPVFTVVNGFNQIVIAESPEEMLNERNILDKLYQQYSNYFLSRVKNKPLHEGLFFINPGDAAEYKNYINQKYPQSSQQNHLNIFANKFELYHKLTKTIIPKVQFRLIPDLTELGELVFKYRKYKHVNFHYKQKYGRNYFQGQPIYLIQPVFVFNKKLKKIMPIQYYYKLNKNKDQISYEAIFMNYRTALIAWQKFKKQATDYNLPSYPKILVYNLEDFMKTFEDNKQVHERNILLIPSQESFQFLKQRYNKQSQIHILQKFSSSLLYLKVLSKRILWSLTSRQPTSW
uniref:hypothetical protein n=1 Tax=Polyopes affinis TaxID=194519 RepID=UPI002A7EB3A0|nr:hypothetical protein NDC12_pgp195 [Polyopes affinis]WOL36941.1 hypothetical protein [Polyopes affinis]